MLIYLILKIKRIHLAIGFTVCLTQEMVLHVSLENKKNAKYDFAFVMEKLWKKTVPEKKIVIEDT